MRRIEQILLLLLIGSIPIQLGYHFWPSWAFVSGIRVDYLSPILYFSDLFLLALVLVFIFGFIKDKIHSSIAHFLLGIIVVSLISLPFIVHFEGFTYALLRLCAYTIFGFSIARNTDSEFLQKIANVMVIASIPVIVLEIAQFILQSSIQGPVYFLGERSFSLSTPGIARFSVDGNLILRPYATFPHPNVLAFYLFTAFLFARWLVFSAKKNTHTFLYVFLYVLIFIGILFTFSRVLIFCVILLLLLDLLKKKEGILLLVLMTAMFAIFFLDRFSPDALISDFVDRFTHALGLIAHLGHKVFVGVGLNQYFYYQIEAERELSPYFLQPPHSVPLLVLIQLGLGGLVIFFWGIIKTMKNILVQKYSSAKELKVILLTTILFASLLDHYFVTLHQGILLTAFVFGIAWSKRSTARELD